VRHLATIRTISDIRQIEGADRIVVAQIDGWECVVKKDEFQVGDKIVYIEVDSVVPEKPEFEFLRERKFRVRTIKLRGQISQGLVLPLSVLPDNVPQTVGSDVTEVLGITKYDPQAQQEATLVRNMPRQNKFARFMMRFKWYRKFFAKSKRKGGFPEWIVKTDEVRIQNLSTLFEIEKKKKTRFSVTEKLDGQSATYFLRKVSKRRYEFGVCSRNILLNTPDNSSYWTVARQYDIENVLRQLIGDDNTIVLQGEICGPGIQGNKYQFDRYEFFAFNLIYPNHKCSTREIVNSLASFGIRAVPIVEEDLILPNTISELVEYSKGDSVVYKEQKREGVVIRNTKRGISFKVINPEFLLAEQD